ncbi:MAG: hypothetical protein JSS10_03200 [Verrucomicrobia bacterium]|nr:hypothetical protein [Verrucomicrobiota bacterium]
MVALTFPPQALKDLSPFGITSPTQTRAFLLALQRAAVAAGSVFLLWRYKSELFNSMPCLPMQERSYLLILPVVGYCLSAPATNLGFGSCLMIKGAVKILTPSQAKTASTIVWNAFLMASGYYLLQEEGTQKLYAPVNLLDRVFAYVADKYSGPVFDRFFDKV